MPLCCDGCDDQFNFQCGDEITFSDDNQDYSILRRIIVLNNQYIYQLKACDPTNSTQLLQINSTDENKMTKTNCLDIITKMWDNLPYVNNNTFKSLIFNKIMGGICESECTHNMKIYTTENSLTFTIDGVDFTKTK